MQAFASLFEILTTFNMNVLCPDYLEHTKKWRSSEKQFLGQYFFQQQVNTKAVQGELISRCLPKTKYGLN